MNNEPVAWMSKIDNHIVAFDKRLVNEAEHAGADNWMPMYLHPAKEPTDDEILQVYSESEIWVPDMDESDLIEFARAILRKAQESCNGFCGEYECKENKAGCKRKAQEK